MAGDSEDVVIFRMDMFYTLITCCLVDRAGLDEKRVRNKLMKSELGFSLAFRNYKVGLSAIHNGDCRPFKTTPD